MPKKLTDCVSDVKKQGKSDDSAWGICVDSTGEKPHHETKEHHNPLDIPFGYELKEKANTNRQDPYPSPKIKKGKVEPLINKTPKNIGGEMKISETRRQQEAIMFKQIFDSQMRNHVYKTKK